MINDETTWHCINQGFCAFKVKLKSPPQTFCRNENNVTGLCNRVSCPLANSQYATVMEKEGVCYLYIKTVERAHTPKNMWEKIKLSANYMESIKQINDNLLYWPDHMINRCKQRLTKIKQSIIRQRKMALSTTGQNLVTIKKKTERREAVREEKAEKAAKVDLAIEKELLQRLKQGTYGNMYMNVDQKTFEEMLDEEELEEDEVQKELEIEEEIEDERDLEYVEGIGDLSDGDDDEEMSIGSDLDVPSLGDLSDSDLQQLRKRRKIDKKPKVEIEYEMEEERTQEKLLN